MDNISINIQILRKNVKKNLEVNNTLIEMMNEMLLLGPLVD